MYGLNDFLTVMAEPFRVVIPDLVSLAAPTTGLMMYSVMELRPVLRIVVILPGERKTVIQQRLQKLFAEVILNNYEIYIYLILN